MEARLSEKPGFRILRKLPATHRCLLACVAILQDSDHNKHFSKVVDRTSGSRDDHPLGWEYPSAFDSDEGQHMIQSRWWFGGPTIVGGAALSLSLCGCGGGGDAAAPAAGGVNGGVNQMGTAAGVAMPGMEDAGRAAPAGAMPAAGAHGGGAAAPAAMPNPAASMAAAAAANGGAGAAGGATPTNPATMLAGAHAGAESAAPTGSSAASAHGQGALADPAAIPGPGDAAAIGLAIPTAGAAHGGAGSAGVPGADGLAGFAGPGGIPGAEGQPEGGGAQQQQFPIGTMQYPVQKLMQMAKAGDYTGADEIISDKAKALAGTIRDNELSDEQTEAFKTTFDNFAQTGEKNTGTGKQVTFRNGQNQFLQFTVVKEGQVFRIRDLVIRESTKK
jgi:hypothetical protein